jgi:putative ABC transport system ATP-binding protein
MMVPAIVVDQVSKVYAPQNAPALNNVSLTVSAGEVLLLMGASGSGKTTLLSIMGCILRASHGSIKVMGQEIAHLNEKQLPAVRLAHIGFVFQSFNLFPTLTASENILLALDLKGIRGRNAHQRAATLLTQVGLSDKFHTFPANLSGGQKQRVAIARALAGDPQIILADEPTAALDSHSGRSIMEMLRNLAHERARAVVIVTHDNRTLQYADRIVHIEDGRVTSDTPALTIPTSSDWARPPAL